MNLDLSSINKKLIYEISLVVIVKVIILMVIQSIWFSSPVVPVNQDQAVAKHIVGN